MHSIEKGLEPDWWYTLAPASVANLAPRNFVSDGEQNFGGQMSGRSRISFVSIISLLYIVFNN
jgi:hypothetical protein